MFEIFSWLMILQLGHVLCFRYPNIVWRLFFFRKSAWLRIFLQGCRMILWVTGMHVISASYCEFCHINREKQRDLARNNMYDEGGCGRRVQTWDLSWTLWTPAPGLGGGLAQGCLPYSQRWWVKLFGRGRHDGAARWRWNGAGLMLEMLICRSDF